MKRPMRATVELLRSARGKELLRAMVQSYLDGPPDRPEPRMDPKEKFFTTLVKIFIEHLNHWVEPDLDETEEQAFRDALRELYHGRYEMLYPSDPAAACVFREELLDITPWLAIFTFEVWVVENSHRPGGPERPNVEHLHWAREAFGWWRAKVHRLPYKMKLKRPPQDVSLILDALTGEQREELERRAGPGTPVEVEDGCPLC
jgi:hypothetical protein